MPRTRSPYRIEPACAQDLEFLIALLHELFILEQDFTPDAAAQRRGLLLLLEEQERSVVLVARTRAGEVVGMVSVQLVISTAEGAPSAWIEDVVVRQDHRAQGLGRQLMQAAGAWAKIRGATRAQLLVDTDNAGAMGFYRRLGWQKTHLAARRLAL